MGVSYRALKLLFSVESSNKFLFWSWKKSKELSKDHHLNNNRPVFNNLKNYRKLWSVQIKDLTTNQTDTIYTPYVCVCSGMFFELINNTDESFEFFEFIMKIINSLNKFNCELEDKYYLINQN